MATKGVNFSLKCPQVHVSGVIILIVKSNWKKKRVVNNLLSKLKKLPVLLRAIVWLIWLLRFALRKLKKPQADCIGGVMVNDSLKLIYIGNPKVASSTMKTLFMDSMEGSQFFLNISYSKFAKEHISKHDYCKFSFVRDPVERVYSCWQDKISNNKRVADIFIITRFRGLYPDMPFEHFVEWLCSADGQDEFADRHWMSQSKLLVAGNPRFDNISFKRVDKLNECVLAYSQSHNLSMPKNLSMNSSGNRSQTKISETISSRTLNLIYTRYERDYDYFGALFEKE